MADALWRFVASPDLFSHVDCLDGLVFVGIEQGKIDLG